MHLFAAFLLAVSALAADTQSGEVLATSLTELSAELGGPVLVAADPALQPAIGAMRAAHPDLPVRFASLPAYSDVSESMDALLARSGLPCGLHVSGTPERFVAEQFGDCWQDVAVDAEPWTTLSLPDHRFTGVHTYPRNALTMSYTGQATLLAGGLATYGSLRLLTSPCDDASGCGSVYFGRSALLAGSLSITAAGSYLAWAGLRDTWSAERGAGLRFLPVIAAASHVVAVGAALAPYAMWGDSSPHWHGWAVGGAVGLSGLAILILQDTLASRRMHRRHADLAW